MIEYLKNIIPRIKQYSKELDKSENFVDKNWIYIDENQNRHEYIFLRDKRLIMTLNSITKVGSWDLLPTGEILITRSQSDVIKLSNLFIEEALLVLKYSATNDTPFILINQTLIPDLNVVAFLEKFEQQKQISEFPLGSHVFKLLKSDEIYGSEFYEGQLIKINNIILNGTYKAVTDPNTCERYIVLENSRITRLYFNVDYTYKNTKFRIEQKEFSNPILGDKILDGTSLEIPTNQLIKVKNSSSKTYSIRLDSNYLITMSIDNQLIYLLTQIIATILIIFIFVALSR
jgi:hypothetical protein